MTRAPLGPGEPFATIDWSSLPATTIEGAKGTAVQRSASLGTLRIRYIEFSAGYQADHWCRRGHVGYVVAGSFTLRIDDGRSFEVPSGQSFTVGDDIDAHMLLTDVGASVFLVD